MCAVKRIIEKDGEFLLRIPPPFSILSFQKILASPGSNRRPTWKMQVHIHDLHLDKHASHAGLLPVPAPPPYALYLTVAHNHHRHMSTGMSADNSPSQDVPQTVLSAVLFFPPVRALALPSCASFSRLITG